ncbi:hypothetical protein HDU85_001007 [Gaertneriomyces sp. JEL0708]|nr:hypothetical protein HDU85_001007 [Gaertneriomyces sp. JEL0708]
MAGKTTKQRDLDALWKQYDHNANNLLSLAELQHILRSTHPALYDKKPLLMRAYRAADLSNDGFITRSEFGDLLYYLDTLEDVYDLFKDLDKDGDRRLSKDEFIKGWKKHGGKGEPLEVFKQMDTNNGGWVLFDEFCAALAENKVKSR